MSASAATTVVVLSPSAGSFFFPTKYLSLLGGSKVILGSEQSESDTDDDRMASTTNGWFAPKATADSAISAITPLPLSSAHAELWSSDGKIFINDLESPFGTFVNGSRITKPTALNDGDEISLGRTITRNSKTPAYITDDHLKPVLAMVKIQRP